MSDWIAAVMGAGQVSACGVGVDALRRALERDPPAARRTEVAQGFRFDKLPVLRADTRNHEWTIPRNVARRLTTLSGNCILAVESAVRDFGIEFQDKSRVGIVAATGHGPMRSTISQIQQVLSRGDAWGSPFDFSVSVHNSPASAVSTFFGFQGPCISVTGFSHSWFNAVNIGIEWLVAGRIDDVVIVGADEYEPVLGAGLAEIHGFVADGVTRPSDHDACTRVPGETTSALIICRPDDSRNSQIGIDESFFFRTTGATLPEFSQHVLLGSQGFPEEGRHYRRIEKQLRHFETPARFWGWNPVSDGMLSIAAIAAILNLPRNGVSRARGPIDCVSCDASGLASCLRYSGLVEAEND